MAYKLRSLAAAVAVAANGGDAKADAAVTVRLVSSTPLSITNAAYASWNIDSSCNRGFHQTNFSNPNLAAAARGLFPSRLRFGGSGNDNLVYGLSEGSPECAGIAPPTDCSYTTPGCLNATHWANLYEFSRSAGVDFMFGLAFGLQQACTIGEAYVWNNTNAKQLLAHLLANNQTEIWGFELGNELNNQGPGTSCNLHPKQQADALGVLFEMLRDTLPGAWLIGPDSGGLDPLPWLQGYLPAVQPGNLHAITHHVYNGINRASYNSADRLDNSAAEIAWYTNVSRSLAQGVEIWAGENGPIGGGNDGTCGANSVCGTYASTMWYADDMATRAKHGFAQYQRHDFFGGAYGLTNSPSGAMALGPNDPLVIRPDYWINFLWKRTIGTSVLNASSTSTDVRAYAFTGTPPSPYAAIECGGNSPLQLLLINLNNATAANVTLPPLAGYGYAAWSLTALPNQPEGPFTTLSAINGEPTAVTVDVSKVDPSTFLSGISQAPVASFDVSGGAVLPPISTTFLCYVAAQ